MKTNQIILAIAAVASASAFADTVHLKSGSVLTGEAGLIQNGQLLFKSDDLGDVKLDVEKIAKLDKTSAHVIQYNDNSRVEKTLAIKDGALYEGDTALDMSNVKATDPGVETWHGSVNGAFTAARGNTYENSWSIIANLNRRWEQDRLTLDGGYYYSKTGTADGDRQTSLDRWELEGQEDHFWSDAFYSYVNLRYDRDKVAQLNARYRVGVGGGYQWLDGYVFESTGKWSFNQELGLNWIKEEYEDNDDQKQGGYAALRYAHHLLYLPKWNENVECFHNLEYLPEVDDWDKYLVKADIGFSTKVIGDIDLLAKIEYDFNSKPANDRKKTDIRYIIGLGYKW